MGLPGCVFPGCVPSGLNLFRVMSLPGCGSSGLWVFRVVGFRVVGIPGCGFPGCVLAPILYLMGLEMKTGMQHLDKKDVEKKSAKLRSPKYIVSCNQYLR